MTQTAKATFSITLRALAVAVLTPMLYILTPLAIVSNAALMLKIWTKDKLRHHTKSLLEELRQWSC